MGSLLSPKWAGWIVLHILTVIPSFTWGNTLVYAQMNSAEDRTNTRVRTNDNEFLIDRGRLSQDGENLFHSFQEFNLNQGEIANFLSDPQVRNILGRVIGGDPSLINGLLRVTGGNADLYLINPAGIVFGAEARLNLSGSFFATTADRVQLGDRWFNVFGNNNYELLLDDPSAFSFALNNPGSIINAGELSVSENQSLVLMGNSVINTGDLEAAGGHILVMAVPGENLIRFSQPGNVLSLDVRPLRNPTADIAFDPLSLPALLTIGEPLELGATVIGNREIRLSDSGVVVPALARMTIVSGTLDVSTTRTAESQTPTIAVLGDRIGVLNATLDASAQNGGDIFVGGDYQGQGDLPLANRTFVDADSVFSADALTLGDGGTIIVWAEGITAFYGTASVRGGLTLGDGGLVEVSGLDQLIFEGNVDLSVTNGNVGTLLLDPENITIVSGTADSDTDGTDRFAGNPSNVLGEVRNTDLGPSIIYESELEEIDGDIILEANNNITIENLADDRLTLAGVSNSITFTADVDSNGVGDFQMQDLQDWIEAPGWSVSISGANITVGTINTRGGDISNGGDVNLIADGDIVTAGVEVYGDFGTGTDSGDIRIISSNGSINTTAGILSANTGEGNIGSIYLRARGDINTARITNQIVAGEANPNVSLTIISEEGSINTSYASSLGDTIITDEAPEGYDNQAGIISGPSQDGRILLRAREGSITFSGLQVSKSDGTGEIIFDSPNIFISDSTRFDTGESVSVDVRPGSISTDVDSVVFRGNLNADTSLQHPLIIRPDETISDSSETTFNFRGSIGEMTPFTSVEVNAAQVNLDGSVFAEEGITFNSPITLGNSATFNAGTDIRLTNEVVIGNNLLTLSGNLVRVREPISGDRLNVTADMARFPDDLDVRRVELQVDDLELSGDLTGNRLDITADRAILSGDLDLRRIELQVDDLELSGNLTAENTLTIRPPNDRNIVISESDRPNALNLSPTEISLIQGDGRLTLGRVGADQAIRVLDDVTFNVPVNFLPGNGIVRLGADVTTTGDNLRFGNTSLNNDVRLSTDTGAGDITFTESLNSSRADNYRLAIAAGTGDVQFTRAVGEQNPLQNIDFESASRILVNDNLNIIEELTFSQPLILTDNVTFRSNGVQFDSTIQSEAREANNLEISPGEGDVQFNAEVGASARQQLGDIAILNGNTLTTNAPIRASSFRVQDGNGDVNLNSDITTTGDAVDIATDGNITVQDISTNGGDINLDSRSNADSNISTGNLDSASPTSSGDVTLEAAQRITTGNIITRVDAGDSGDVVLNADQSIETGNINTSTDAGDSGAATLSEAQEITTETINTSAVTGDGGDVVLDADRRITTSNINTQTDAGDGGDATLNAAQRITTDNINTSADAGDGGDVILDPRSNIEVGFINTESESATGGDVIAETERFFLSTDTFEALDGTTASISAQGGDEGGDIVISHFGGEFREAFNVTNLAENGTVGAIVTGTPDDPNTIESGQFPGPFDQFSDLGDIRLITQAFPDEVYQVDAPDPRLPNELSDEEEDLVFLIERYFTNQVERYFSRRGTEIKSLQQVQEDLRKIEEETGVKPAVIYAYFVPQNVDNYEFLIQPDFYQPNAVVDYQLQLLLVTSDCDPILVSDVAFQATVAHEARSFRNRIKTSGNEDYLESAQQVYNWLVDPLENYPEQTTHCSEHLAADFENPEEQEQNVLQALGIQNLVFITDVNLRSLPLAALHDGGQYIIENYSIGYMPSMSLTDTRYRNIRDVGVLAMGTDRFQDNSRPLPAAPVEVRFIDRLYDELYSGRDRSRALLYEEFTAENLRVQYQREPAGIVHLGTHGVFNPVTPQDSYIQFIDGRLTLDELRTLGLNRPPAELLVLSACQTAVGSEEVELGFAGIAYQLGVKSVLAGVFNLPDSGTLGLITQLFSNLQEAPIKAEALRQAQLSMMRGEVFIQDGILTSPAIAEGILLPEELSEINQSFTHPAFWAGFTLIGNPW